MTLPQEYALTYLQKKKEAKDSADLAKGAEEDMVHAAQKAGVDSIKVRDDQGNLVVFQLDNRVAVKKTVLTDIKIEKAETEAVAAAGAGGSRH